MIRLVYSDGNERVVYSDENKREWCIDLSSESSTQYGPICSAWGKDTDLPKLLLDAWSQRGDGRRYAVQVMHTETITVSIINEIRGLFSELGVDAKDYGFTLGVHGCTNFNIKGVSYSVRNFSELIMRVARVCTALLGKPLVGVL